MFNWLSKWFKMFNFFKKKKQNKEKQNRQTIPLNEIDKWFEKKVQRDFSKFEKELDEVLDVLLYEIKTLKKNSALLMVKELEDETEGKDGKGDSQKSSDSKDKAENKEIKEMENILLNKDMYAKKISDLEKSLALPENIEFMAIKKYIREKEKEISELCKHTSKIKKILDLHFANEMNKISENIKNITQTLQKIDQITQNEELKNIELANYQISAIKKLVSKKNDYSEMIDENESKYAKLKDERERIKLKLAELKKDAHFKIFEELQQELKDVRHKIGENKKAFRTSFFGIEPALQKLIEFTDQYKEITQKYENNPEEAFIQDVHLEILEAVKKAKQMANEIEPDEKKRAKLTAKLDAFDEMNLQRIEDEKSRLQRREEELQKSLNSNNLKNEMDDSEYKLVHIDEKMKKLSEEINDMNKVLEKTDIEEMVEKAQELIEKITKERIRIEIRADEKEE